MSDTSSNQPTRHLSVEDAMAMFRQPDQLVRLRSMRDVGPLGYALAMLPAVVDWTRTELDTDSPKTFLRNVNYGGNPIDGTTVLRTIAFDPQGIESAEFHLVPLDRLKKGGLLHHAQLRFCFREDSPIRLLGGGDHSDREIHDLVVSWEAWRPAGTDFSVIDGMSPENYDLSMRVFAGPQRFLEDSMARRDWFAYPLRIPGGQSGLVELLEVSLLLGDGVARHALSQKMGEAAAMWEEDGSVGPGQVDKWNELKDDAAPRADIDPDLTLPEERRTYQTILRSCATLALYSVTLTVDRLSEAGISDGVDLDKVPRHPIDADEKWMHEVAGASFLGIVRRAPKAIAFFLRNPQSVPSKIPGLLHAAGLIEDDDSKPHRIHYSLHEMTPYGKLRDNLFR